MTVRIPLSTVNSLGFDFAEAVESFRQAKLEHRFTVNEPAPAAHPVVEACVVRMIVGPDKPDDYVSDYEVYDDTPPPPPDPETQQALDVLRETIGG